MLKPRQMPKTLPSYHPPLAGRSGLRLDFNENTVGCSPRVLERLRTLSADDLGRYPEREATEAAVACFLGVNPEELLLTNGVDEAIHLLCQTYLEAGDEVLIVVPTYSMYRIYAMAAGAEVISVPAGANFEFPAEEFRSRLSSRTKLIAIANPNNPTGVAAPQDELLRIAGQAPSAALLVDEAYFEFYGQTILKARTGSPNIFVARTFSKAYGMAGLRVGALIGHSEQMRTVRCVSSPYNVNAVALACLPVALADQPYINNYVTAVRASRARLERGLAVAGIQFRPSHANFVLVRIGSSSSDAATFVQAMRRRGILVRDRSTDYGCEGCVRITLGTEEHTDRLLAALEYTVDELGIGRGVARR